MADNNAKKFYDWAQSQVYKNGKNGKISNAQKLKSPYIINKYKTWGDVLNAAVKDYVPDAEKDLRVKYQELEKDYNSIPDKTSKDSRAQSVKKEMDKVVQEYQKVYSAKVGTPVSFAVAKAAFDKTKLSTKPSGEEPVTLEATKTAKETKAKETKAKEKGLKLPEKTWGAGSETPPKSVGGTFTEPMTIAGQVSTTGGLSGAKKPSKFEDLIGRTEFWYNLPDYIFKVNPALKDILVKAVDEGWDDAKFLAAAQQTPWWQQNSSSIRTRIIDKAKYDELRSQGLDVSKTDYALDANTIKRRIKGLAQQKGANLSEEQLDQIVAQAYNGFLENDTVALTQLIAPYIGKTPTILKGATGITSTYSGEALQNYQMLQNIARQNGFKLTDILPNVSELTSGGNLEDAVLKKLALGELDINAIAQNARILAATGQPQYVRDLLNQGYDLADIYAPYRKTMADTLELSADQIELSDPTLRMAISDKGDMNLYDYNRMLRKDNRWQYTKQARDEVANATQRILQDFGFMG